MAYEFIGITILIVLFAILFLLGIFEQYYHSLSLNKIPIRIHVNGSRGKSSVVRLIAAGLRAGGHTTIAKTTGTSARIINSDGTDTKIHRLRTASIGEQVKLIRNFAKKKPDAVVFECMAVHPQYQWISEHKMIQSHISVITNARLDHIDEMGTNISQIAKSLSNTIPFNKTIICNDDDEKKIFEEIAQDRGSKCIVANTDSIDDGTMEKFKFIEHKENVAIALSVCNELGIDKNQAIDGMVSTQPDPGALVVWDLNFNNSKKTFISAFAANDPQSTLRVLHLIQRQYKKKKISVFLNTRIDRIYRTKQLINLLYNKFVPSEIIIRGDHIEQITNEYDNIKNINIKNFSSSDDMDNIIECFAQLDSDIIIGIGNMVGWGENFLNTLSKFRLKND